MGIKREPRQLQDMYVILERLIENDQTVPNNSQ